MYRWLLFWMRWIMIKKLKKHFATHRIPNTLLGDNGPPFTQLQLCWIWELCVVVWSRACNQLPCYLKSNRRVENAVKTVKNCEGQRIRSRLPSLPTELEKYSYWRSEHLSSAANVWVPYPYSSAHIWNTADPRHDHNQTANTQDERKTRLLLWQELERASSHA